ncbi:hypothetical protein HDU87_004385 [Geranomyces variabilis]|uniref:Uncharacterized protein n=1 Tax=Geranomyces variabilis TaxID=109894 RepID=A0AAD5TL43_9FUNG|nr:hypothetical protein HDU87_004385 [Geranomyces variabilis]
MPAVPYTVAQQIVCYLLPDLIVYPDFHRGTFLSVAVTCQSFKTAAYQHRKVLMLTQAATVRQGLVMQGFPIPPEAKNPYVNLDYILSDCTVQDPHDLAKLLEKYRDHFARDMEKGLIVIVAENGDTCSSTAGRYLARSPRRPNVLLMKDVVYIRGKRNPAGVRFKFAMYTPDSAKLWTPASFQQKITGPTSPPPPPPPPPSRGRTPVANATA